MFGWMILFALLALPGLLWTATGVAPPPPSVWFASLLFTFLFFLSLAARVLRGHMR